MPLSTGSILIALGAVSAYLRKLRAFSVHTDARTDEILDTGQKVQLSE